VFPSSALQDDAVK